MDGKGGGAIEMPDDYGSRQPSKGMFSQSSYLYTCISSMTIIIPSYLLILIFLILIVTEQRSFLSACITVSLEMISISRSFLNIYYLTELFIIGSSELYSYCPSSYFLLFFFHFWFPMLQVFCGRGTAAAHRCRLLVYRV